MADPNYIFFLLKNRYEESDIPSLARRDSLKLMYSLPSSLPGIGPSHLRRAGQTALIT